MNPLPPVLAHGALGVFDEIIFLGVGVIFLVLMAVSWLRSRNQNDETTATAEISQPDAHTPEPARMAADAPDPERYALD